MRGGAHAALGAAAAMPLALLAPGRAGASPWPWRGPWGGLLPDIDHPGSTLGRFVPWPAVTVENHKTAMTIHGRRWFGGHVVWHRHETHSVGAAAMAAVAMTAALWYPLWRLAAWAARLPEIRLPLRGPLWTFAVTADMLAGCADARCSRGI